MDYMLTGFERVKKPHTAVKMDEMLCPSAMLCAITHGKVLQAGYNPVTSCEL